MTRYDMDGKVALVVGATSGIGKVTAEMFAKSGAKVVLSGRRENLLKELTDKITADGGKAAYIVCDVTDESQAAAMVDFAVKTFGRLDYAYNNAGIMPDDTLTADLETAEFYRVITVNLRRLCRCMTYEL